MAAASGRVRPVRLELEGFGAFRERTVVDFDGVDLFAFVGPDGCRQVDPGRRHGASPCTGRCPATATAGWSPRRSRRERPRPGSGSTSPSTTGPISPSGSCAGPRRAPPTKEARLETADGELVAGNEKELGAAVERLLGLEYDHFCKCVVLPQGRFAEFLHDKPEARQELLVELLDLGVYRQMGRLARLRATESIVRAGALDGRLSSLAWATPERRAELTARHRPAAPRWPRRSRSELPVIDELGRRLAAAATEAAGARERLGRLETGAGARRRGRPGHDGRRGRAARCDEARDGRGEGRAGHRGGGTHGDRPAPPPRPRRDPAPARAAAKAIASSRSRGRGFGTSGRPARSSPG